mmetsp:Transcript_31498/g.47998  ORF Transcript_31498/g.47998 Transcript_31498/m.47998 type:complete len:461 (+) Transcript_31498:145-1527(+)
MRKENEYINECLSWFFNALVLSLLLQYIRRIYSPKYNHLPSCLRFSLSRGFIPDAIAKDWIHRFSPTQIDFLIRVVKFKHDNLQALQAHLIDDSWRMEGIDFVDSVLLWLLGIQVHPLLIVMEALIFVGGDQQRIPKKIVDFTARQVFLDSSRQMTLMQKTAAQSHASTILYQLEELGLLYRVENGKVYRLSKLIQDRPIRVIDWNKKFLIHLDRYHPDYATHHLIRLMIRANEYEKAMEIMESDKFCRKRVRRLGNEAAVKRHIVDCTLLLKYSESSMLLPQPRINKASRCLADYVHDSTSLLNLGIFLQQKGVYPASNILHVCVDSTMQDIRTNYLLSLAKLFDNVGTIYLCYGNEEYYRKYKDISNDIGASHEKTGIIDFLDALKVPLLLSEQPCIVTGSAGLNYHLECIREKLNELTISPLMVLFSASLYLGDVELATKVKDIQRHIYLYNKRKSF